MKDEVKPVNKRGSARLAAVQALYQLEVTGANVIDIAKEYELYRLGQEIDGDEYLPADIQWFRSIIIGVVEQQTVLDPFISKNLPPDWPLSRLDSVLRSILRAAIWELKTHKKIDVAVIINEYVELSKAFFAAAETRLVNGVLHNAAGQLRIV
ncbi:transcription antitermination factor NusB [Bartonella sp. TP]|uniref:transcription antitermination factor NusB n=1 Tax=Bartonella sp. TP TaxID=3057550 RepID=UPI0025B24EF6|nr:transcription antitermination factor NusB [Bartonella sp. TP]MDN5248775.1 transcription antitermination factor NusB [Alphaproteobacteria bacterium]WJW80039.1 transcription antitermination factor NusB [Bartonella sp. TP]